MKVRFESTELDETYFVSYMPILPKKGEQVGFWCAESSEGKKWIIAVVDDLVYEFDEKNKFQCVAISLIF